MKVENVKIKNENGSVILVAVVVLLVLSVVIIMGSNNSLFELKLAGNDRCLSDMRANAESAALAGLEEFKALGDDSADLRRTAWAAPARQSWYHKGENDCITDPTAFNGGDLNRDDKINDADGEDALGRARAFSQAFFGNNSSGDNWDLGGGPSIGVNSSGSCAELLDSSDNKIPSMENAKFMVLDTGPPPAKISDSLGLSMDPSGNRSWHQILVTGVDEKCGGKYMVQVAYLVRF